MQNVQNAAEIQQRVINLVELYRTKVGKESQSAKDLADEYKNQYDNEIDIAYSLHQQGIPGYVLNIDIPEDAIDELRGTNERAENHKNQLALACQLIEMLSRRTYPGVSVPARACAKNYLLGKYVLEIFNLEKFIASF